MENEFDVRVTGNVNSRTLYALAFDCMPHLQNAKCGADRLRFRKLYAKSEGTSEGEGIVELNFRGFALALRLADFRPEHYVAVSSITA